MKRLLYSLILLPICLVAQPYQFHQNNVSGGISVRGEATVCVTPDIIRVRFGIETNSMELVTSQSENRAILKRALEAFRELGLEDESIKTDFLSVEPRYYRRNNKENDFLGYFSQNGFVVTVNDKETLEKVVDAALHAGVNYLHGVEFLTSDLRKYRDQAREMAAKAAREKAGAMAAALGAQLGAPTNINIDRSYGSWGYHGGNRWNSGSGSSNYMAQNSMASAPSTGTDEDGALQLGKISVQAAVNVNFQIFTRPQE